MTKEELEKEAREWIAKYTGIDLETQRAIKLQYHDNLRNAYLASAEPREKRIAELEEKLTQKVTLESLDVVSEYVKQLEQENAELSMKRKAERKIFQGVVEKKTDQLTKAKEIISEFVEWANWQGGGCPSFKNIQDKAEQLRKDRGGLGSRTEAKQYKRNRGQKENGD